MHRRLRVDVVERQRPLVLVDLLAGDLPAQDAGEDVAVVVRRQAADRHGLVSPGPRARPGAQGIFVVSRPNATGRFRARAAFSAMPLMPSRRFSSAQTSSGRMPHGDPEHDQVIQHVGALGDHRIAVAGDRLDQALDRFLAEFLRHLGGAARQQPRRVADRGIGVAPAHHHRPQPVQHRRPPVRSPAAAADAASRLPRRRRATRLPACAASSA